MSGAVLISRSTPAAAIQGVSLDRTQVDRLNGWFLDKDQVCCPICYNSFARSEQVAVARNGSEKALVAHPCCAEKALMPLDFGQLQQFLLKMAGDPTPPRRKRQKPSSNKKKGQQTRKRASRPRLHAH